MFGVTELKSVTIERFSVMCIFCQKSKSSKTFVDGPFNCTPIFTSVKIAGSRVEEIYHRNLQFQKIL